MKKFLTLLMIFAVTLSYGQRNWAVEGGVGLHLIADESADLRDNVYHLDGVVRYSFNERFGVGLYGGYDRLNLENFITGEEVNTNYYRLSLQGVIDAFEVLKMRSKYVTLLAHGGFGYTYFDTNNGFDKLHPSVSGGLTGLVKLSTDLALKVDWSTTGNFQQSRSLDNGVDVTNVGINSFVSNATVGLVVYLSKKKSGKSPEHYDWWNAPEDNTLDELKAEVILLRNDIRKQKPVQNVYKTVKGCNCSVSENVYFKNDFPKIGQTGEETIEIQGRNAIEKIANALKLDKALNVYLTGSASNTKSTTVPYDLDLSKRRVEAVKEKLLLLGVDENRIKIDYFGKDYSRNDIHEFARKVSLEVR